MKLTKIAKNAHHKNYFRGSMLILLSALFLMSITGCASPMYKAIKNGNSQDVKKEIANGAVNTRVKDGNDDSSIYPLGFAACVGNVEIVKELIAAGADLNKSIYTNRITINKSFFESEYDCNGTPIELAILRENVDIVKELIEAGADLPERLMNTVLCEKKRSRSGNSFICDRDKRKTPLSEAEISIIQLLINASPVFKRSAIDSVSTQQLDDKVCNGIFKAFGIVDDVKSISNNDDAFELYQKQVDKCIEAYKPDRKYFEIEVLNELLGKNGNSDIERIKQTKEYIDKVDSRYKDALVDYNAHNGYAGRCSIASIIIFDDSIKLPIIYDHCQGTDIARLAISDPKNITPEQILNGWFKDLSIREKYHFSACISKFKFVEDNYASSKEYFINRLQKDQDEFAVQGAKNREAEKEWNRQAQEQMRYLHSPRGKCEETCNNEYRQNSDMWKSCMSLCKDLRDDIIE